MIPYTPEELIALAKNELAWCTKEMLRASHDMGYGDDWHKALEHVKGVHVAPGEQPEAIRKLAVEGIEYMKAHDLVTVPPLAEETWRMEMMTPERQLVNPFFTGGEVISVSYPTDTMTFEQRMMSMRGNNIPFSRSTVFHELIPGHYLQQFMSERYRSYRRVFDTPFWFEGNAFYWEMLLWDMGFPRTPEERAGMLFWRMHRCARIIFSLSFHLGLWTPQQCVDFLVSAVGHEVDNATAEVRRSFNGSVGPLYQCAYMLGALQFRAMHKELVESGKMTNRAFHDAILKEGPMPVEMVRADLTGQKLTKEFKTEWKFYGEIAAKRRKDERCSEIGGSIWKFPVLGLEASSEPFVGFHNQRSTEFACVRIGERGGAMKKLRSHEWFVRSDKMGFMYRSWIKNQGWPGDLFDGRPVIGICNTWSELTPCNAHFREIAEWVKRGVWEMGGFPLEFPVMSLGEVLAAADRDVVPEPGEHGCGGVDSRESAGRCCAADGMRQDYAFLANGSGIVRFADDWIVRRADAVRKISREGSGIGNRRVADVGEGAFWAKCRRRNFSRQRVACTDRRAIA